jgi:ribulose 1,5-bisphosphate synthetase/thiazole synthase
MIKMSSSSIFSLLILLLFICRFSIEYDIIIYTATPSGIAAAITAARTSPSLSVIIIEPTPYVGGMVSAGGIGLRDTLLVDVRKFFFHIF